MLRPRCRIIGFFALAVAVWSSGGSAEARVADLVFIHGHIFTGVADRLWVEALSIRTGRIRAVGSNEEIIRTVGPKTRIIDLQGRMAMPGINDAHDHAGDAPFGTEAILSKSPLSDPSISEVSDAVRAAALKASVGTWIRASVGPAILRNAEVARKAMDQAGLDHPVVLSAWWGHGVLVNATGLRSLGITDSVKDPTGGSFDRDRTGHLTGLLNEYVGWAVLRRLKSAVDVHTRTANIETYVARRVREGVTSVQIMGTEQQPKEIQQSLIAAHPLIRVRLIRFPIPAEDGSEPVSDVDRRIAPQVRLSGVKYILDGTPIEQLALQSVDYPGRPGWRGQPDFSSTFLEARLRDALKGRTQLCLHVVGDAMAVQVLDAMERMAPADKWRPLRVRLEHANGIVGAQIDRARRLGIVIAQPRPMAPIASWLKAGIQVAYGSDVTFAPWSMFQQMTAVNNPERITRVQALGVLTSGPAYAEFAERTKGRLTLGSAADITVLSQDPTVALSKEVERTRSLLTMVAGRVVYDDLTSQGTSKAAVRRQR